MSNRLPGTPVGPEEIRIASGNPRDKFSYNERLKAWEELEKAHKYNRGRYPNLPWGMNFFAGDMGRGKTLSCARVAVAYYWAGWEVCHAGSLLFGRRLEGTEVYTFPQQLEDCSLVYLDEPQVWFESYVPQTLANRSVSQVVTTLRKLRCKLLFSTAAEQNMLPIFRTETEMVYYPDQYYPNQARRSRLAPDPGPPKLRYPPWCYIQLTPVGPYPWRRHTLADAHNVYGPRAAARRQRSIKIAPSENWFAAKLYDSFERVQVAAGMRMTGAKMRDAMDEIDARQEYSPAESGLFRPDQAVPEPPVEEETPMVAVGHYMIEEAVMLEWFNALYQAVQEPEGVFGELRPEMATNDPRRGITATEIANAASAQGGPALDPKKVAAFVGTVLGVQRASAQKFLRYDLRRAVLKFADRM